MSQEVVTINIAGDTDTDMLQKLVRSYSPEDQNTMLRTALVVYQIKRVSDKEENGTKVMRKLTPFEVIAYIETAKALSLNPILNHLIFLEGQVYITLDGHIQNGHQSLHLLSIKTTRISAESTEVGVKKWVKGENGDKGGYQTVTQMATQYRYKCTITKRVGEEVGEYEAEGVADISNVVGGDKNTDLKIEQMAEARAMRRCLKRAFPVGLGSYEDTQDMPDYVLPEGEKGEKKEKKVEPKKESEGFDSQLFSLLEKRGYSTREDQVNYLVSLGIENDLESLDDNTARDILLTITPL